MVDAVRALEEEKQDVAKLEEAEEEVVVRVAQI